MSYIPSSSLATVLEKAQVGVWFDELLDGKLALVCKLPDTIIKSLFLGARASLLISVVRAERSSILCIGFRVQDERDHPFTAIIPSISKHDATCINLILSNSSTTLHCLNELNHPVLSADCALDPIEAQKILKELLLTRPYLSDLLTNNTAKPSSLFRILDLALERFQTEIYRSETTIPAEYIEATGRIPLTLNPWKLVDVFEVSPTVSAGPFRIDDDDEGSKQEKALHQLGDSIYPGNTYRSPKIQKGLSMRELIDVLGFGPNSICLIESKVMTVLTGTPNRSSQRLASTAAKHIAKGLNQLEGALVKIRSGTQIYDADDKPFDLPGWDSLPAHAIVLLSEMYAFLDWQRLANELVERSQNERCRALFQVMDLSELSHLVKASESHDKFNKALLQRWVEMKMRGTAYIRVEFAHSSDEID